MIARVAIAAAPEIGHLTVERVFHLVCRLLLANNRFPARTSLEHILVGLLRDDELQRTVMRSQPPPTKPAP